MSSLRLSCLAARSLPIACGSLIVNTASMSSEAGQVALHDVQAALAGALAVLVVGQDLDASGSWPSTSLQPLTRSITSDDLRAVLDDHLAALAVQLVGDVLAGDLAGLDIVGLHRGVGAGGGDVDRDDDDAGRLRRA